MDPVRVELLGLGECGGVVEGTGAELLGEDIPGEAGGLACCIVGAISECDYAQVLKRRILTRWNLIGILFKFIFFISCIIINKLLFFGLIIKAFFISLVIRHLLAFNFMVQYTCPYCYTEDKDVSW